MKLSFIFAQLFVLQFVLVLSQTCPPGNYIDASGACIRCPAGSFQTLSNATECTKCKPGSFQPSTGVSFAPGCFNCPVGTFSKAGSSACSTCPNGMTSKGGYLASCFRCEKGFRVGKNDEDNCVKCSNGYTDNANFFTCLPCPEGSVAPAGATSIEQCKPCPPGSEPSGTTCKACAKNSPYEKFTKFRKCVECQVGTKLNEATNVCEPCPAGRVGVNNAPPGYRPIYGNCFSCDKGSTTFTAGKRICRRKGLPCPADSLEIKSGDCLKCSPFQKLDVELQKCVPCPGPNYRGGGIKTECTKEEVEDFFPGSEGCPPGTYVYNGGGDQDSIRCNQCLPNTFSNKINADRCTVCPYDAIQPGFSKLECIPCPKGRVRRVSDRSLSEAVECVVPQTNCPPGSRFVKGEFGPVCKAFECPSDKPFVRLFESHLDFTCSACAEGDACNCKAGQTFNTATKSCQVCSYSSIPQDGKCVQCPSGTRRILGTNKCGCTSAIAGSSNFGLLNGTCVECPAGLFGKTQGEGKSNICTKCPVGTRRNPLDLKSFENCLLGPRVCREFPCVECPVDTFASEEGSTECKPCPAGSISARGSTQCTKTGGSNSQPDASSE